MSGYCSQRSKRASERASEDRTTNRIPKNQLLCVSQNACQWRIFLAWDMQTWTKNEFTTTHRDVGGGRSKYYDSPHFGKRRVFLSIRAALAIFMHLSWEFCGPFNLTKNNSICLWTFADRRWKSGWHFEMEMEMKMKEKLAKRWYI